MAPQTTQTPKEITLTKTGFDLDSKTDVTLMKVAPFTAVGTMQDFVSRLGNDSDLILKVVNDGLEEYERKQLAANDSVAWLTTTEEGEIAKDESGSPIPFSGTLLIGEKAKQFAATVLNIAKMAFGYPDGKLAKGATKEEQEANRVLKAAAKSQAQDMILSNPVTLEALKK